MHRNEMHYSTMHYCILCAIDQSTLLEVRKDA